MIIRALVALALCAPIAAAAGEIYRCVTPEGKTIFTDQPCPKSARGDRIDVRPTAPTGDAIAAAQEKLARDNADFNSRFDAREKARADAASEQARADAWAAARQPIIIERPAAEPVFIPYSVTTCGGPGQPRCFAPERAKRRPPAPPPSITVPRKDLSTVGK